MTKFKPSQRRKDLVKPPELPEIEIPSVGLGTMRTGATLMAILLQAEPESHRPEIMADLLSMFGISGADISDIQNSVSCSNCGMAGYLHENDLCP